MKAHKQASSVTLILLVAASSAFAQGRGGRGGVPNMTSGQSAALAQLNATLAAPAQKLIAARTAVVSASLAEPRNDAAIRAGIESVHADELALANARAAAFAALQSSPDKLSADQIAAFRTSSAAPGRGGGGGGAVPQTRTSMPHVTIQQADALIQMTAGFTPLIQSLGSARGEVVTASLSIPRDDAAIRAKVDAVAAAELALATARADALAKLQAASNRLDPDQIAWLVASGGSYGQGGFTEPEPMDFNDHRGYVSLFDGVSLKGWDGNPKFWRANGGSIVGQSTPQNPSGNTYIAYRDVTAKDFTLKFEMKIEGDGGSGLQYRSKTGIPWSRPIPANVTANVGPVNLNWMMTGPQADFWPSRVYTGQFYSENTPMGIMAWRGQVVEGAGLGAKRLMGTIGDRTQLGTLVKMNDWNQYTVIARGGTLIHIVNGQLMAVMVDDDPESSNNQAGIFGIEIEATTKVYVRNIWLKKIN
ncbi:MAG TPA: DUF1080 domain-containing protein [Bryobacteraceae bacterium]|nr:DUF1080 domain-containing protein [Bryobacteraceae bacterium]